MPRFTRSFLFPDVNVWIALTYDQHVHHAVAAHWFSNLNDDARLCFCRITQLSFLRLLTTKAVMSTEVKSQAEAWQIYDRWLDDPHIVFLEEPLGLDPTFRDRSQQTHAAPNDWADSYLVAFASVSGLQIVTFDRGMRGKASGVLLIAN